MKDRRQLRRYHKAQQRLVTAWLCLTVLGAVLGTFIWRQASRSLAQSHREVAFNSCLDRILKLLVDAETSQRGFTITGDVDFLEPLVRATNELDHEFTNAVEMARTQPELLEQVVDLRAKAVELVDLNRQTVEARRTQGFESAAALVRAKEGKKRMDSIRKIVGDLQQARAELAAREGDPARETFLRAELISLVVGLLAVGAGVIALILSRASARVQVRELEMARARREAERASEEKSAFLANVSHEIRTPMNAILGFTDLLDGEIHEPKLKGFLRIIRSSSGSLLRLINDVLDLSRVEAGRLAFHPEPTDPREVCEFVRTMFSDQVRQKGIRLDCHVAEALPRAVLLDRVRLRQILVNLVGNAVKFTDQGGVDVAVKAEKLERSSVVDLIIEVQDTGPGIPEEKLDTIFQPFAQIGVDPVKELGGTGLGLAIVKRLTEGMGGTVTVASVIGQGAAFSLRFPAVEISARLPTSEALDLHESVDFGALQESTILAVDDNEANLELIRELFKKTGHTVEVAGNGEEALELVRRLRPDLVLLDVRMPRLDGNETLDRIRAMPGLELLPVIAVTASNLLEEEGVLRRHFSGFIRKPFRPRELFDQLALFIPRKTAGSQGAEAAAAREPAGLPSTSARQQEELVSELARMLTREWPNLRDTAAINEARTFASRVRELGLAAGNSRVVAFAEVLEEHAAAYAVQALEAHIAGFPRLVESLGSPGTGGPAE